MLFLKGIFQQQKQQIIKRKETDSFLEDKNMSKTSIITSDPNPRVSPKLREERASLCTSLDYGGSKRAKASITVEASLAIPIFFLALICIIYLMEMLAIQISVRSGMQSALDTIVGETTTLSYVSTSEIENFIIESIGSERLDQSIIVGGSNGLDCSGSSVSFTTGLLTLHVTYEVELPIPQFGLPGLAYEEEMVAKMWTGYDSRVDELDTTETYYITDTSSVYHLSRTCTHLQLDISSANSSNLEELRNEYGGKYSACSKCVEDETGLEGTVYIASTGSRYHSTLSCSGLTRVIYEVSSLEIIGMGVCSRCGSY